jgi:opacity protein-like surface antigen
LSVVLPKCFYEFFRAELEYNYNTHYDKELTIGYYYDPILGEGMKEMAEIRMDTVSVQLYADIPSKTNFTPFLNAGVGITRAETEYNEKGAYYGYKTLDGETTISWNVGAGISAKINDCLTLDAMYRYTDFGRISDLLDTDVTANKFMIGARYRF